MQGFHRRTSSAETFTTLTGLGITPTDYPSLMAALTTGKTQQISQARAGVFEFGAIASSAAYKPSTPFIACSIVSKR